MLDEARGGTRQGGVEGEGAGGQFGGSAVLVVSAPIVCEDFLLSAASTRSRNSSVSRAKLIILCRCPFGTSRNGKKPSGRSLSAALLYCFSRIMDY